MAKTTLTPAEKKWHKELETLLAACPSKRLEAFTEGDPTLVFYDKEVLESYMATQHWKQGHGLIANVQNSGALVATIGTGIAFACGG